MGTVEITRPEFLIESLQSFSRGFYMVAWARISFSYKLIGLRTWVNLDHGGSREQVFEKQ